jgi:hypothetical protein
MRMRKIKSCVFRYIILQLLHAMPNGFFSHHKTFTQKTYPQNNVIFSVTDLVSCTLNSINSKV